MVILLAALEKCHQQLYKNILRVKDNRYNRHNRRKYSLKVDIVLVTKYRKQLLKDSIADDVNDIANTYGTNMVRFCLNSIGRKKYFGQTDILLAALEKYRQLPYKNILRIRVND